MTGTKYEYEYDVLDVVFLTRRSDGGTSLTVAL